MLNLLEYQYNLPIIVSTHPRTLKRLKTLNNIEINSKIFFLKPFGFFDYNKLQINSKCTISDSGSISEESAILNFPAVLIRNSTERPESLDNGTIIITGLEPDTILDCINLTINEFSVNGKYKKICDEYLIENTSMRVVKIILGTINLNRIWHNK